jgi:hypothetical protein
MKLDLNKVDNLEFDGIDFADYPDFVDAYLISADYNGKEMTEEQIDYINDEHYDFINEQVYSSIF